MTCFTILSYFFGESKLSRSLYKNHFKLSHFDDEKRALSMCFDTEYITFFNEINQQVVFEWSLLLEI